MQSVKWLLVLLVFSLPLFGQGVYVQSSTCGGTGTTPCGALTNTLGNTLVAVSICNSLTASPTISDTNTNTYNTRFTSLDVDGGGVSIKVFEASNIAAGSNTVTFNQGGVVGCDGYALEFSFLDSAGAFDQAAAARTPGTTNHSSGNTSATTSVNETIVGVTACQAITVSAGSGFTGHSPFTNNFFNLSEEKNVTSTGVQAATFTTSTSNTCTNAVATFKSTTQPAPTNGRTRGWTL